MEISIYRIPGPGTRNPENSFNIKGGFCCISLAIPIKKGSETSPGALRAGLACISLVNAMDRATSPGALRAPDLFVFL